MRFSTLIILFDLEDMYDFSYLCKMKRENGISRLISALGTNCKLTSGYNSGIFMKYSRMLITQQSGCASGTDCFRNLKNTKSDHSVYISIVKYP